MSRSTLRAALAGLVAGVMTITLLPSAWLFVPPATEGAGASSTGGTRWACPMMDYIGNQPGRCPVCGMKLQPVTAGELNREQQTRMGLELTTVTEGPATVIVRAYGAAEYDHRFTRVVIPRVAGRILKRHGATFGAVQEVAAGTPIVDLYSTELIAAQGELRAAVTLGDRSLVDALRQRFERWNLIELADRVAAGEPIQDTVTIRTPFGGQVLLSDFEGVNEALSVGREIMPDTPLLRLVDADKLVLVIHVPESRAHFLREGQAVEIASDDGGPQPGLKAVVGRLAPEIDPEIRTREVRVYLEGARHILLPGSLVSARIKGVLGQDMQPADPADSSTWGRFTLVPKAAVLSTGVRHLAWRVAERGERGQLRFDPVPLVLGPRLEDSNGNDLYVVQAGLKPGDEVATQAAFLIDSQAQLAGTPSLIYPDGAPAPAHQH